MHNEFFTVIPDDNIIIGFANIISIICNNLKNRNFFGDSYWYGICSLMIRLVFGERFEMERVGKRIQILKIVPK